MAQATQHPEEFRIINAAGWSRRVTRKEFEAHMVSTWAEVMAAASWEVLSNGKQGWAYHIGGAA